MAFVAGINFRATAAFVTDGTSETYSQGYATDTSYSGGPVSRGGFTFGWDGAVNDMGRDRDSGIDRRLAGMNQATNNGTQTTFRLDLAATGNYTINLAIGDGTSIQGYQWVRVLDNTTTLFTIIATSGTAAGHFLDAQGNDWSAAAWPGSNVARIGVTFSSTILNVTIGSPAAQANSTTIAHLYVAQEASGPAYGFGNNTSIAQVSRVILF